MNVLYGLKKILLSDAVQVILDVRHRKFSRDLHVIWNPVTQRLDPLVCEFCKATIRSIRFREGDSNLRACCYACERKR